MVYRKKCEVIIMQKDVFYKTINDNSVNGELIGEWHGIIGATEFMLVNMGSSKTPRWLATNKQTDDVEYYDSFDDTISKFKINNIPIKEQIDKIDKFDVIEFIN